MLVAGIDQGTTSTKSLVLDDGVQVTKLPTRAHRQSFPAPGLVEQDASELLDNVRASINAALRAGETVLGLANQGETVVAWDRDTGRPLAPAIVWQDQRTAGVVEGLARDGHAAEIATRSGLPLDCYFSASKLRWLLENATDARPLAKTGRLGLGTTDSYFIERLTGRYATDPTTASRTSLMNLQSCEWDSRLGDIFGVPIELLPEIADDRGPIGQIETDAGSAMLAAAAVDQVAALYGHGCRRVGSGKVTIGTGAFALIVVSEGAPSALPRGSIPTAGWVNGANRVYAADGGVYTAAAAVEWLLRIGLLRNVADLDGITGASAASEGVFFVPALSGLAFPHWDRSAAGLFIGLDTASGRETLIKAVLEGIAFRIAEVVDGLGFAPGAPVPIDGGLSRSRYFSGFLADVTQRPLLRRDDLETTAFGVAELALACARRGGSENGAPSPTLGLPDVEPQLSPAVVSDWRARFSQAVSRARGWRQ